MCATNRTDLNPFARRRSREWQNSILETVKHNVCQFGEIVATFPWWEVRHSRTNLSLTQHGRKQRHRRLLSHPAQDARAGDGAHQLRQHICVNDDHLMNVRQSSSTTRGGISRSAPPTESTSVRSRCTQCAGQVRGADVATASRTMAAASSSTPRWFCAARCSSKRSVSSSNCVRVRALIWIIVASA